MSPRKVTKKENENGDRPAFLAKGQGVGDAEGDPAVAEMQSTMESMGTHIGDASADGRFGPETEKAVKRVQRRFGLKSDGIVGPQPRTCWTGTRRSRSTRPPPRATPQ